MTDADRPALTEIESEVAKMILDWEDRGIPCKTASELAVMIVRLVLSANVKRSALLL
jgi:hypothetical protein